MSGEVEFNDLMQKFVNGYMAKWDAENPNPDSIRPTPPEHLPSICVEAKDADVTIHAHNSQNLDLIVSKEGYEDVIVRFQVHQMRELLESILEVQFDMETYHKWVTTWGKGNQPTSLNRSEAREEARKEARRLFLSQHENRMVQS